MSHARHSVAAIALLGCLAIDLPECDAAESRAISTEVAVVKKDLDGLIERRLIRVAAPYSRTLYYNDKGRERGLSADLVRDFEQWINRKYAKGLHNRPITVVIRPMTRDKLPTTAGTCTSPLEKNLAFGQSKRIRGTPTMIFEDGERVPGAISMADLEKRFAEAKAPATAAAPAPAPAK